MVALLNPNTINKFSNQLPIPQRINATIGGSYEITIQQFDQWLGLYDANGNPIDTTVWGYGLAGSPATYPGPTFVTQQGVPIEVIWSNQLPLGSHLLPRDTTFHQASAGLAIMPGLIPTVTHLHGAESGTLFDGYPESWFTQGQSVTFTYENNEQAGTLWYHDHTLGITRLNVFAGLAGFYFIEDENRKTLADNGVLPGPISSGDPYNIEMAIQDRSFTSDGSLYLPAFKNDPLPGTPDVVGDIVPQTFYDANGETAPSAVPEYFGDFIMVNGMAWPNLDVAQGNYEFHWLNGSDSRFYLLGFDNPNVKVTLVGADGALLPKPIVISDGDGVAEEGEQLVLAPGDRVDVVVDFSQLTAGQTAHLINIGPAYEPFKGLNPDGSLAGDGVVAADPALDSVGQVMQFTIDGTLTPINATIDDNLTYVGQIGDVLLNPAYEAIPESQSSNTRRLGLFEGEDEFGRIEPTLGLAEDGLDINGRPVTFGNLHFADETTEDPLLGSTEVWEVFNYTEDAHPVHVHIGQFQVLGKYAISDVDLDGDGYLNDIDYSQPIDLRPEDTGWQDTVWVGPGEVLKIIHEFTQPGDFVWHCHILSHEDHDMMRTFTVVNTVDGTNRADALHGTEYADQFDAGRGFDVVFAGAGNDRIIGHSRDGFDAYFGGDGIDTYDLTDVTRSVDVNLGKNSFLQIGVAKGGGTGVDALYNIENVIAGAGNDKLNGNKSDNYLAGGAGNDQIRGFDGNDTLWGQSGNDRLTGDAGNDTFLFYKEIGSSAIDFGLDVITDFTAAGGAVNHDVLEFDMRIFTGFDAVIASSAQVGADTVITYDAQNSITLQGVALNTLTIDDFLFF